MSHLVHITLETHQKKILQVVPNRLAHRVRLDRPLVGVVAVGEAVVVVAEVEAAGLPSLLYLLLHQAMMKARVESLHVVVVVAAFVAA